MPTPVTARIEPGLELCAEHGLAATHQRQVLPELLQTIAGHPSPEDVYLRAKKRVPAISLATVDKNIQPFVEKGVPQQRSMHHGFQPTLHCPEASRQSALPSTSVQRA